MSNLYHKIPGLYMREESKPFNLIEGVYREPELELLKDIEWTFTEKVDGTNIRVIWDGHNVVFGGRTENAQIPSHLVTKLNELFMGTRVEQVFEQVFGESEAILFGESYGAKIQKGGGNYSETQEFVLFDVKVGEWYLKREDVEDVAEKFSLKVVPIVAKGNLQTGVDLVKAGLKSQWGDFIAEGLVAKPTTDLFNRKGERILTKIKTEDFAQSKGKL
jgi:ATP-dependent RNA circularization protein (DNA/RNA ligase family)